MHMMEWIEYIDEHHGFITALATIVIAAFTGTLYWATRGLWIDSKKSIGLARQAMRVSSKAYVFGDVHKESIMLDGDKISLKVHAINYGNSPAMVERIGLIFGAAVPAGK